MSWLLINLKSWSRNRKWVTDFFEKLSLITVGFTLSLIFLVDDITVIVQNYYKHSPFDWYPFGKLIFSIIMIVIFVKDQAVYWTKLDQDKTKSNCVKDNKHKFFQSITNFLLVNIVPVVVLTLSIAIMSVVYSTKPIVVIITILLCLILSINGLIEKCLGFKTPQWLFYFTLVVFYLIPVCLVVYHEYQMKIVSH